MRNRNRLISIIMASVTLLSSVTVNASINIPSQVTLGTTVAIPVNDLIVDQAPDTYSEIESDLERAKNDVQNEQFQIDSNAADVLKYLGFDPPTDEEGKYNLMEGQLPDKKSKVLTEEEFWALVQKYRDKIDSQYIENRKNQKHKTEESRQHDADIQKIKELVKASLGDINLNTGKKNQRGKSDKQKADEEKNKRDVEQKKKENEQKLSEAQSSGQQKVDDARDNDPSADAAAHSALVFGQYWDLDYTVLDYENDAEAAKAVEGDTLEYVGIPTDDIMKKMQQDSGDTHISYEDWKEEMLDSGQIHVGPINRCSKCGALYGVGFTCNCSNPKFISDRTYKYAANHGNLSPIRFTGSKGATHAAVGTENISKDEYDYSPYRYDVGSDFGPLPDENLDYKDEQGNNSVITNNHTFFQNGYVQCAHCFRALTSKDFDLHEGSARIGSDGQWYHKECWDGYELSDYYELKPESSLKKGDDENEVWGKQTGGLNLGFTRIFYTKQEAVEPVAQVCILNNTGGGGENTSPTPIPPAPTTDPQTQPPTHTEPTSGWSDDQKQSVINYIDETDFEDDDSAESEGGDATQDVHDDLDDRIIHTDEWNDPTYQPFGLFPSDHNVWTGTQKELYDQWVKWLNDGTVSSAFLKELIDAGVFKNLIPTVSGDGQDRVAGGYTVEELQDAVNETIRALDDYTSTYTSMEDRVTLTATFDEVGGEQTIWTKKYSLPGSKFITITHDEGQEAPISYANAEFTISWMPGYLGTYTITRQASWYDCTASLKSKTTRMAIKMNYGGKEVTLYEKSVKTVREDIDGIRNAKEQMSSPDVHKVKVVPANMDIDRSEFYDTERIKGSKK